MIDSNETEAGVAHDPSAPKDAQDCPECAQEITGEMIRAGVEVVRLWHPDFDSVSTLVRDVYLSMLNSRKPTSVRS